MFQTTQDRVKDSYVFSFLANYEIPSFQHDRVSHINIWVMDDIGGQDIDSCGKGSTADLEAILKSKNISYSCTDNYRPIRTLQCVDFPADSECSTNNSSLLGSLWIAIILPLQVLILSY
ncbi:hypothetical protein GDO86_000232 [Hymenochirus boettgeri]|uniref:ADP-ribosyl cyclase/cyclic ADP-ribose hydrolase n=1 Tax=Hymenochirus boettgeri TaxID=247094 RepID=A0A8T2KB69_9PIPI|nr:hypothetical protein GDO86_000232 [Hymenochirus boettgeri]